MPINPEYSIGSKDRAMSRNSSGGWTETVKTVVYVLLVVVMATVSGLIFGAMP